MIKTFIRFISKLSGAHTKRRIITEKHVFMHTTGKTTEENHISTLIKIINALNGTHKIRLLTTVTLVQMVFIVKAVMVGKSLSITLLTSKSISA